MPKTNKKFLGLLILPLFLFLSTEAFSDSASSRILSDAQKAYAAKDYGKAARLYQEVVQGDPANAVAFEALGNCEYALGHKAEALTAYNNSLVINPYNAQLASFAEKLRMQIKDSQPAAESPTPALTPIAPVEHIWKKGSGYDYIGPEYDLSAGPVFGLGGTGIGLDQTYYFTNGGMFALGGAANVYIFGLNSPNLTYFGEGLLQLRVTFGDGVARPFLLVGGGLNAIDSANAFSSAGSYDSFSFVVDPMLVAGAGVLFSVSEYFRLFLQAKASITFLSGVNTTLSSVGYTQTPSSGGTLTYYPVLFGFAVYF